jgi:hypothetical protein
MLAFGKGRESKIAAANNINNVLEKALLKALYDILAVILRQSTMHSRFAKDCASDRN